MDASSLNERDSESRQAKRKYDGMDDLGSVTKRTRTDGPAGGGFLPEMDGSQNGLDASQLIVRSYCRDRYQRVTRVDSEFPNRDTVPDDPHTLHDGARPISKGPRKKRKPTLKHAGPSFDPHQADGSTQDELTSTAVLQRDFLFLPSQANGARPTLKSPNKKRKPTRQRPGASFGPPQADGSVQDDPYSTDELQGDMTPPPSLVKPRSQGRKRRASRNQNRHKGLSGSNEGLKVGNKEEVQPFGKGTGTLKKRNISIQAAVG
ncbi:hypothetical protein BDV96DRAFT_602807 [Lophiotrema nucula]|uniref:Uncharacterized protein n=1 Tax=Lophiotrema nucula TaxID=690887 RepID=A0A6A5YXF1_9PLEO|nr:hypothetical protein BDV96DRAFT_602807 [Lophiotrema nucula]